jgi:uncharacterized protein
LSLLIRIARELALPEEKVTRTLALLDEGATVPFIARYRKEQTGSLDEVQITAVRDRATYLRELDSRRQTVLTEIAGQGKLTPALRAQIEAAETKQALEDLYLPFRPRRRTRAQIAREKGFEPLALAMLAQEERLPAGLPEGEEAMAGARDIVAELMSERADLRAEVRALLLAEGELEAQVKKGKEAEGKNFSDYFDHREPIARAPSHRVLALLRGEREGVLRVELVAPPGRILELVRGRVLRNRRAPLAGELERALSDACDRLLGPACANDVRATLKERADAEAIAIFAINLRQLLLAPPLGGKALVAIDPGLRTGCKVAALSAQGDVLAHETIFPLEPRRDESGAAATLGALCRRHGAQAIAIGNGTGGREAELWVRKLVQSGALAGDLIVATVNESGASIYSASEVAREELPQYDVTVRGAVSIGRRLQDPLAELVKIDPQSIGVGQYQHDVDQSQLRRTLDEVVESCVTGVGVEVNTASPRLLAYVAGIGPQLAKSIVAHRAQHGPFRSRAALREVPRLGPKAFEQSAGFLRIHDGVHPLDASAVHPERYRLVERIARDLDAELGMLIGDRERLGRIQWSAYQSDEVGEPTLHDIAAELEKPGRDPRQTFSAVGFRSDVTEFDHLAEGMVLEGVVTNVAAFGAFVDVGVHQDGLVHISELAHRFVRDPSEVVKVGERVRVKVIRLDRERRRIGLSIKQTSERPAPPPRPSAPSGGGPRQPPAQRPFNPIKFR